MLDDDLLSHGETPHYHRRCTVSLLSSGWVQVVPVLFGRQAIRLKRWFSNASNSGKVLSVSGSDCVASILGLRFAYPFSLLFTEPLGL